MKKLIKVFETLIKKVENEKPKGYIFKINNYKKLIKLIKGKETEKEIYEIVDKSFQQAKKIKEKLKEYFETGKIKEVEEYVNKIGINEDYEIIKIFESVPNIGEVKAKSLVKEEGIRSIKELRLKQDELLNNNQKLGLKYYEDLIDPKTLDTRRILRSEIQRYEIEIKNAMSMFKQYGLRGEICGSYRRGLATSGDIDIIITSNTEGENILKLLVSQLYEEGIVKEKFVLGEKKFMGISMLGKNGKARRMDIMYTPPEEYAFGILYFTGSDDFNKEMRKYALQLGYTLNEHRIMGKTNKKVIKIETERGIFKFLGIPYVKPENRIVGEYKFPTKKELASIPMK